MVSRFAFMSRRIVDNENVRPGIVVIRDELIEEVINGTGDEETRYLHRKYPDCKLVDYGSAVIMPGIVDSHVHVNEPGRTSWEGFRTATTAAAVAGVTTIADMPLNSIPPTTTVDNLKRKAGAANGNILVDVGFWAGAIPGNENDLIPLVEAGVVGFKCFLCPSGVDEFPAVSVDGIRNVLEKLENSSSVLALHAECEIQDTETVPEGDPTLYETFLKSRPREMELKAIEMICELCAKYKTRCHIVHLSTADALAAIKTAKESNTGLTVETCPHYLTISSEEVPPSATEFKCCPPIREKSNQENLWAGIQDGTIDMIVSDHSPCKPSLKVSGNFLTAWGGISSLQFGLSLIWTAGKSKGLSLPELSRLLCKGPATLCNLFPRKGSLEVGSDADLVIWDPDDCFVIRRPMILHRNKLTPYLGKQLYGKVLATVLRGRYIYENGKLHTKPIGRLILNDSFLKQF